MTTMTIKPPTYGAVHDRLASSLGSAKNFSCFECWENKRTMDWSWSGCEEPLVQFGGRYDGMRYCVHSEHYEPRCRRCHLAFGGNLKSRRYNYPRVGSSRAERLLYEEYVVGGLTSREYKRELRHARLGGL